MDDSQAPAPQAPSLFARVAAVVGELAAGRMSQWTWVTVALVGVLLWINPELVGPVVKVLSKMTMAAILGYGLDRSAFPYARPHEPLQEASTAMEESRSKAQLDRLA